MSSAAVATFPRRRSLVLWAILALGMVVASYLFVLTLAVLCVYLPYLAIVNLRSGNFQVLALGLCGVGMAGTMVWSLLPRRDKFEPPGPQLDLAAHPRLRAEIGRIAAALKERMPHAVYLVPEVNAWVTDRGGILGFGSRRVMGIGLPLLSVLTIPQFQAVLAHEFAHYYGGDTRLGPWVYKTRMAMVRTIENMSSVGSVIRFALAQAVYAIVMFVLSGYWKLFFRATQWISRRQEYRADELACCISSPRALVDGLQRIHAAGAAMASYWNSEVSPLLNAGYRAPIADGFARFVAVPEISKSLQEYLDQQMREEKPEPYDSHPPLRDRIAAAQRMPQRSYDEDTTLAENLFNNLETEEVRLLQMLNSSFDVEKAKPIQWEETASLVYIPLWRQSADKYRSTLSDVSMESLPHTLRNLFPLAAKFPDPPGMLLTPEQRNRRTAEILSTFLALGLIDRGWRLISKPGEFFLEKDNERLNHWQLVSEMMTGRLTAEAWVEKCKVLGLSGQPLLPSPPQLVES